MTKYKVKFIGRKDDAIGAPYFNEIVLELSKPLAQGDEATVIRMAIYKAGFDHVTNITLEELS